MAEDVRSSILQMAKGAIQERVDYEVSRVIDNILDMNTEPTVKRKVVLTIELKPDEGRQVITMSASAKSTLAPTTPIASSLVITSDGLGEMVVAEIVPQIPGQMNIDGGEQEKPRMPDYETIIVCALIPVVYVVTYMAGKYDLLGQLAQMLQEKIASLTDEYAKVLHGRWEQTGMHLLPYECSACGSKEEGRTNYCPNCGAKMDLEVSDGKA